MNNARFFDSLSEFRSWLVKNAARESELWVGFYKKPYNEGGLHYLETQDLCLGFGWSVGAVKGWDYQRYLIRYMRRKPKAKWSDQSVKRFLQLKKQGKVHPVGIKIFEARNKTKSKVVKPIFSPALLRRFKANKKAWKFFTSQTPSYQKYTTWWVMQAVRPETQENRFSELLRDSAQETKLLRTLKAQENAKPKYEVGRTPIEAAKNIGPVVGSELRSLEIDTLEKLQEMGWEEVFLKVVEHYPERMNLNMLTALIGAIEGQSFKKLDANLRAEAKQYIKSLRSQSVLR